MNRSLLIPISLLLGAALCQTVALAQPAAPNAKPKTPTFSVTELEQFLGGRTLISLDLKDVTLEQVAAALAQAANQKIEARPPAPPLRYSFDGKPPVALPAPLYNFSTVQTPFWPTLRSWQLAAKRAAKIASPNAATPGTPAARTLVLGELYGVSPVPNSLGLGKGASGWFLQPDIGLTDGRAVEAWPFLLIANDLKRNQEGSLSDDGMNAPEDAAPPPDMAAPAGPAAPKTDGKTPDAEHWNDQLTLTGKVVFDPKLRPLNLRCEILEALDDKGNTLNYSGETKLSLPITAPPVERPKPKLPPGVSSMTGAKSMILRDGPPSTPATGFSHGLKIPLRFQPGMGKKLVRLRGVLRFSVVTRSQHWETTQLDKPIDGTVFGNGAEFNVQFKGLEKTGSGWSAGFAAQSRGPQLERIWTEHLPAQLRIRELDGSTKTVSRSLVAGTSWSGVGNPWGFFSALDFQGVPQMSLVDENGRVFEMKDGQFSYAMKHDIPGTFPVVVSPDKSPLPPDLAQNWTYDETRSFDFTPPTGTSSVGAAMGKPVKLILDLPLERREVEIPFEFTNLPLPPS